MEWLAFIGETSVARALTRSPTLYMFLNASHILSLGVLIGASLVLDLRVLGLLSRMPLRETVATLWKVSATGLAFAIITGLLLFSVRPVEYAGNVAFLAKIALVTLGVVNALLVHRSAGWKAVLAGGPPSPVLKATVLLSLVVWISAVIAGRWIGFL